MKGFATSLSILLSGLVSWLLLGDLEPGLSFLTGTSLVLVSSILYCYHQPTSSSSSGSKATKNLISVWRSTAGRKQKPGILHISRYLITVEKVPLDRTIFVQCSVIKLLILSLFLQLTRLFEKILVNIDWNIFVY